MVKHPLVSGPLAGMVLGLLALTPTKAATITSDAFVATARPTIEFLEAAGRLASAQADSARVRAFGRREVESQDGALETLAEWRRADAAALERDKTAPSLDHLGPLAGVLAVPYGALADATSIATPPLTPLPSADRLRAVSGQDLARLAALRDQAFVDFYAATQVDALRRLEAAYKSFILNGDDPILRRLAVKALPKVERLLAEARRL